MEIHELNLKKKYRAKVEIKILEHEGKFYAGYDYWVHKGGGGTDPNPTYDNGYSTRQEAIDATLRFLAVRVRGLHEALWDSGYTVVGEPPRRAEEELPAKSKVAAVEAKLQSQGYDALTDCEKCKLATRCEDCCRVCPPEKHCNAMQCFIRDKEEKEQIAKEQAENNAAVLEHSKQEEQEEETPSNPLMYAAKTVLHELVLLREHYQGAAERQKAIATGKQGLDNLRATVDYLDKYVHKTERYIECLKEEDAIRNSIKGDTDHEG